MAEEAPKTEEKKEDPIEQPADKAKKEAEAIANSVADKKQRAIDCQSVINEVLAKYKCKAKIFMTIGTDGSIKGEFQIVAI